jgi:putative PIN family toxin of toxin-antitoxin system
MKARPAVIDTNVVVAGLLTKDPDSATAWILDAMLEGSFPFLLSGLLLAEYREVLLRPHIRQRHGLDPEQVDRVLEEIVFHAMIREPTAAVAGSPDPADRHLWELVAAETGAVLVTGDARLLRSPPPGYSALNPRMFLDLFAE